jgi:hypothetical protein
VRKDKGFGHDYRLCFLPEEEMRGENSMQMSRLCEIDAAWQHRQPAASLKLLRESQRMCSSEELSELLAADCEWRWRLAGFGASQPAEVHEDWLNCKPRRVETYVREWPELEDSDQTLQTMIEAEFMARSRWCDPPLIAEMVDRFPSLDDLESHLRDCLDELSQIYVRKLPPDAEINQSLSGGTDRKADSRSQFDKKLNPVTGNDRQYEEFFPVSTPLCIGRQSAQEPRDVFVMPDRKRLIVADNYQHGVSRQHATVKRLSLDRCLVTNSSPLGWMKVNNQDVGPGEKRLCLLPLTLELGPTTLQIFQK